MDKASDPPTEKCFSYCSLLLLVGVPLIMFVVFNEALTFNEDQTSASVSVFNAGHVSIRGHRAQYKTNITQLQTSNIQLKADLDALTNKQNALMKKYEEDNEGEGFHLSPSPTTHCNVSATTTIKNALLQREIDNLLTENQRLREKLSKSIRAETYQGVDPTDKKVTKLQLAQALTWTRKENVLLANMNNQQTVEFGQTKTSLKQCQETLRTKAAAAPPTTTAAQASEASAPTTASKQETVETWICTATNGPSASPIKVRDDQGDLTMCQDYAYETHLYDPTAPVISMTFNKNYKGRCELFTTDMRGGTNSGGKTYCSLSSNDLEITYKSVKNQGYRVYGWKCVNGQGASDPSRIFEAAGGIPVDSIERCALFCNSLHTCGSFDWNGSNCRVFSGGIPRLGGTNQMQYCTPCNNKNEVGCKIFESLKIKSQTQIKKIGAPKIEAQTKDGVKTETDLAFEKEQKNLGPSCGAAAGWIPVVPSKDANYEWNEGIDALGVRLDGIKQPPNIRNKFVIEHCIISPMKGMYRIKKSKLCNDDHHSITKDATLQKFVNEKYGPDEYEFHLQGPELIAMNQVYYGKCVTIFHYELQITGRYRVYLVHMRENYMSHSEIVGWPICHYDQPLGSKLFVHFGKTKEVEDSENKLQALLKFQSGQTENTTTTIPLCTSDNIEESNDGGWITLWKKDELSTKLFTLTPDIMRNNPEYPVGVPRIQGGSDKASLNYQRGVVIKPYVGHDKYVWKSKKCHLNYHPPKDAYQCLKGKSIKMHGDSQMQRLHYALVTYVCGCGRAYCPATPMEGYDYKPTYQNLQDPKNKCGSTSNIQIGMNRDDDGDGHPNVNTVDLTFVNFGQHPADAFHKWPLAKYRQHVDSYLAKIVAQKGYKSKFIWVSTPAVAFRKDTFIRGYKDWRTNGRLERFNEYAATQMKKHGIRVLDLFRMSQGMTDLNPDNAHMVSAVCSAMVFFFLLSYDFDPPAFEFRLPQH